MALSGGRMEIAVGADTAEFIKDVQDAADKGLTRLTKSWGQVAAIQRLGTNLATGFTNAVNTQMSEIQFAAIFEGEAEKAEYALAQLSDFAATTPFTVQGVNDAAASLATMGMEAENVIPFLTALGDEMVLMGAVGREEFDSIIRALTQMGNKGKVTAEEMNQLTEAGLDAWGLLAAQLGVTKDEAIEMVQTGLVPASEMFQAIGTYGAGAFQEAEGAMAEFADTSAGQIMELKASMETLWESFANAVMTAFGTIAEFLSGTFIPLIQNIFDTISTNVEEGTGLIAGFQRAWEALEEPLSKAWDLLSRLAAVIADILAPVVERIVDSFKRWMGIAALFFGPILKFAGAAIQTVTGFLEEHQKLLEIIGKIIGFVLAPIFFVFFGGLVLGWMKSTIAGAKAAIAFVKQSILKIRWMVILAKEYRKDMIAAIKAEVKKIAAWIASTAKKAWQAAKTAFYTARMILAYAKEAIAAKVSAMMQGKSFMGIVRAAFRGAVGMAKAAVRIIKTYIKMGIQAVKWAIKTAISWIIAMGPVGIVIAIIALLVAAFLWLWNHCEAFQEFFKELWQNIKDWVQEAVDFIVGLWESFVQFWKDAWENIKQGVSDAVDAIKGFVEDLINKFREIPEKIKEIFADAWNWLIQAGKDIINGLLQGILDIMGNITQWVKDHIYSPIVDAVKSVFGIGSPSKVFEELGGFLSEGLTVGIEGGTGEVVHQVEMIRPQVEAVFAGWSPRETRPGEWVSGTNVQVFLGDRPLEAIVEKVTAKREARAVRALAGSAR